jgi:hypothetical protein
MFPAVSPDIRSGDLGSIDDPFGYFLRRRLGLTPFYRPSEALTRGSWLHTAAQLSFEAHRDSPHGPSWVAQYQKRLVDRIPELITKGREAGLSTEQLSSFVDNEKEAYVCGRAYFEASAKFKIPDTDMREGWCLYFNKPQWVPLAAELEFRAEWEGMPLFAALDQLWFNKNTRMLWPLDLKSCPGPATERLSCCKFEWQTRHYLFTAQLHLKELIRKFGLPADTAVGGMLHVGIQKPPITPGRADALKSLRNESKRSGLLGLLREQPNGTCKTSIYKLETGEAVELDVVHPTIEAGTAYLEGKDKVGTQLKTDTSVAYTPLPERFALRCIDWYLGQGDYLHEADLRKDPAKAPVNISSTPIGAIDSRLWAEYKERVRLVEKYRTMEPSPLNFPRNPNGMLDFGRPHLYSPLYDISPSAWPAYCRKFGLIVEHRSDVVT